MRNKHINTTMKNVVCKRELETEQNCNILTSLAPHDIAVCRTRSPGLLNRSPGGPASLGHFLIPSSSHQLVSKLTDFLSSPSYIIVQPPTQSLEWHVWSSSSGNNCHAVHRSLSTGASVYECTMGFYLVPYCQLDSPTQIEYALPPSLEWHVWRGRRSIYNSWASDQDTSMQHLRWIDSKDIGIM